MSLFSANPLRRRAASLVAFGLALAAPASALASDWEIDTAHTRVGFAVRHLMVSTTRGTFTKFSGGVQLDDKDVTKSTVRLEIEAASIDTANQKRDEHLRSADFFDAAKFPKLVFQSTKVEKQGDHLVVTGNLTIKDVTKAVVLTLKDALGTEVKDPWGGVRRGTQASTKINRKDFGLTWNKALEAGGVTVGDEVTIELDVELIKKKG